MGGKFASHFYCMALAIAVRTTPFTYERERVTRACYMPPPPPPPPPIPPPPPFIPPMINSLVLKIIDIYIWLLIHQRPVLPYYLVIVSEKPFI